MTRKEEILKAARTYVDGIIFSSPSDVIHFENGAKWADEHPNKKLVYTKKELLDMGFGFDLNGNINTPQEIEKRVKNILNYRKNKWIKKACEWLEQHLEDYNMYDALIEDYVNFKSLIIDFRKAMEE